MEIPQDVLRIWDKYGLAENVRRHCVKVMEVVLRIADGLVKNGYDVDLEAVKKGALLHDIGRAITHGIEHFIHTGDTLRKEGMDEKIVRIAERHFSCGIKREEAKKLGLNVSRDYMPETIEEKIVCMADKLVKEDREIGFDEFMERLDKLREMYPETAWFTELSRKRALKLKEELGV